MSTHVVAILAEQCSDKHATAGSLMTCLDRRSFKVFVDKRCTDQSCTRQFTDVLVISRQISGLLRSSVSFMSLRTKPSL